jgi:hypothetical protein
MEMLRTQRRVTVKEGGWADMTDEMQMKVLELLQAEGGLGFSVASTVRLVCAQWKAVHDALLVMRLVLRRRTTDEAVGMVRAFRRWRCLRSRAETERRRR